MKKKVKVLYVVTESEWAGASRYVFDLATHLPPEFEAVAAAGRGDMLEALQTKGIRTVRLRWLPRTIRPLQDFLAFWEILFLYFRERPDIIHLNSSKAGWLGSLAAFLYKLLTTHYSLLTIFTAHGWVFNEPGRANWFFRRLERFASHFRDVIICVSENDRREALHWRIAPPHKFVTIHNGIDAASLKFLDRESAREKLFDLGTAAHNGIATPALISPKLRRARNDGAIIIGTVANFYPNKGLEYLIEAVRLLTTHYSLLTIIIGDGPERHAIEALIKKYDLQDRVFLAGRLFKAWRYLKAFDCFVLPSIKEGLPYAILEALAAGVPVVASAVGGVPEIKARGGGVTLVPPAEPGALARALQNALQTAAARPAALPDEFRFETMLEKTLAVYANK